MNRKSTGTRTLIAVVSIALASMFTTGCVWTPELSNVARDIESQLPDAHFEKEFSISLGPIALGLAKIITSFVDDDDVRQARGYLRSISRVQVAVYETNMRRSYGEVRMPKRLAELEDKGWETAVKVRDRDEAVWVMYKIDKKRIRELYVVVLSDEELVLVKARGNLEQVVARALAESKHHRGVPGIGRELGNEFRSEFKDRS